MLAGKTAIVTGSTSGIGLGIATALAEQKVNVMLNGFGEKDAIEKERKGIADKYGVKAAYSPADMSKPADIRGMIETTEREFGAVDILVNNAGIQHVAPSKPFLTTSGMPSLRSISRRRSMPSRRRCLE